MRCVICYEDFDDAECEAVVMCHQHCIHAECLFMWNRSLLREENQKNFCPMCHVEFKLAELAKIQSFKDHFWLRFIEAVKKDDVNLISSVLSSKMPISLDNLKQIFKAAVESESREVAKFLRKFSVPTCQYYRESLIKLVFDIHTPIAICWIANNLDNPSAFIDHYEGLDMKITKFLVDSSAYRELFYIYCKEFQNLSAEMQLEVGLILYEAVKNERLFHESDLDRGRYTSIFFHICNRRHESNCFLRSFIIPTLVRKDLNTCSDIFLSNFWYLLSHCEQCKKSHMWDAVKMAVLDFDVSYLRILLSFGRLPSELPFKYGELADIVLDSENPEMIRDMLEAIEPCASSREWKRAYLWAHAKRIASKKGIFVRLHSIARFGYTYIRQPIKSQAISR